MHTDSHAAEGSGDLCAGIGFARFDFDIVEHDSPFHFSGQSRAVVGLGGHCEADFNVGNGIDIVVGFEVGQFAGRFCGSTLRTGVETGELFIAVEELDQSGGAGFGVDFIEAVGSLGAGCPEKAPGCHVEGHRLGEGRLEPGSADGGQLTGFLVDGDEISGSCDAIESSVDIACESEQRCLESRDGGH